MVGEIIGAGIGMLGGIANNAVSSGMTAQARWENYHYNEMAADNADKRTRALYEDFYSPSALMRQYREAGLSPSMMFGGTPGQGGQSGAQGSGPAGPQPTYSPMDLAYAANQMADAKLKNALADRTAGHGPMGEAELQNLFANTANLNAQTALTNLNGEYQKTVNYITKETANFKIEEAENLAQKSYNDAMTSFWEAKNLSIQFDLDSERFQEYVKQAELETQNLQMDLLVKAAQKSLTDEQKKAITEQLRQGWAQISIATRELAVHKKAQKAQKKYWEESIEVSKKSLNQAMKIAGIDAGTKVGTSLLNGLFTLGGASIMKGILFKGAAGVAPVVGSTHLLKGMSIPYGSGGGYYGSGNY